MRVSLTGIPFWSSFLQRLVPPSHGKAYVVGGWVRDMMMLRRPSRREIDLAVEGNAVEWGRSLAESFGVGLGRISEFNTCKVNVRHEGVLVQIDIASCRKDVYPTPGGMPVVTPASLSEDLFRSDFSVNAMAFSLEFPVEKSLLLLDPVGGRNDLARKELRILSRQSFEEDPVRIFRLFRFQERLGFRPDSGTARALEISRVQGDLQRASKSRLWDEIQTSVKEKARRDIVFRWLSEKPWEKALPSLAMSSPRRARVFDWERLLVHERYFSTIGRFWEETLLFLALFYGLPRQECDRGLRFFGFPEKKAQIVRETLFPERSENSREKKIRSHLRESLSPPRIFLEAVRSGGGSKENWEKSISDAEKRLSDKEFLSGDDLVREGILPSPEMGVILEEVRNLRREGVLNSRNEALEWVRARQRTPKPK